MMAIGMWALPMLRPAGPGNTGPVDLILVVAVGTALLWVASHHHIVRFPYALPVGLSILAGTLASTVAYAGGYGGVGGGLLATTQDAFILAWGLAVANVGREPAGLRSMSRAWAISASFWAAVMIIGVLGHISALSGVTARNGVRAAFTLGDPNLAADYFVCSLLVLRAVRYPRKTWLRWGCCLLILTAIFFTGSNGGVLALLIGTACGVVFKLARRQGGAAAVLVATGVLLMGTAVVPLINVQSIVMKAQGSIPILRDSIGRQAESSGSRSQILSETKKLWFTADTPLGIGPNGTKSVFQQHGFSYVKSAHDDYSAAVLERGLLGGVALAFLAVMVAVRCRRIATRPLRPAFAEIVPRPELLGASAIAVFFSAMFYEILHFRHVWALFGLVAAVDLWGRTDRDGDKPDRRGLPGLSRVLFPRKPAFLVPGRHRDTATGVPRTSRFAARVPAVLTANVAARIVALVALTLATVLVAHAGGPKLLGELALLRVLPGLAGVLVSCGLPTAIPYFLAGRDRVTGPRLKVTLIVLTIAGALLASACWLALTPLIHRLFFHSWRAGVVVACAVPVCSQLFVAAGKAFLQGENDMRGANYAIAAEEAVFLPVYLAALPFLHGTALLMVALVGADVLVADAIAIRLARRGFLRRWARPDPGLAVRVCKYGLRGQVGGIFTLLNLRLDVAILGALAGPGVLGVYAVASKYAELLRLPGLAVTYVLYPRLASRSSAEASRRVVTLLPGAFALTVLAALPLAAAVSCLPLIYGSAFRAAVIPALILLVGLLGEGVAGVVSAYLYGVGRPGANSLGIGVAVIVTIALDVALIPRYQAIGASVASAAAYLTSTGALLGCFLLVRRLGRTAKQETAEVEAS